MITPSGIFQVRLLDFVVVILSDDDDDDGYYCCCCYTYSEIPTELAGG